MSEQKELTNITYFLKALCWSKAMTMQGNRIIEILNLFANSREVFANGENSEVRDVQERLGALPAEEHFFLISAGKCLDWLGRAELKGLVEAPAVEGIKSYSGFIADARNMREHDDEYLIGEGNKKARPRFVQASEVKGVSIDSDATCSGGAADEYYVGHGVHLFKIMDIAAVLSGYLEVRLADERKANRHKR